MTGVSLGPHDFSTGSGFKPFGRAAICFYFRHICSICTVPLKFLLFFPDNGTGFLI